MVEIAGVHRVKKRLHQGPAPVGVGAIKKQRHRAWRFDVGRHIGHSSRDCRYRGRLGGVGGSAVSGGKGASKGELAGGEGKGNINGFGKSKGGESAEQRGASAGREGQQCGVKGGGCW